MIARPNGFEDGQPEVAYQNGAAASHRPVYVPGVSPPPHNYRKRSMNLPPSPYERVMRTGAVESLMERAATFVGYVAVADGEPIVLPQNLLHDLGKFAAQVVRLCRSHQALEELVDAVPDAKPRTDDG